MEPIKHVMEVIITETLTWVLCIVGIASSVVYINEEHRAISR